MIKKIIPYYSIFLGISVLGIWIMILLKGNIPEGRTELSFHLTSEFLMALVCIVSGFMLLRKHPLATRLNILAFGMMIYSLLNATGYYGERNDKPMTVMFLVLFCFSSAVLMAQIFKKGN